MVQEAFLMLPNAPYIDARSLLDRSKIDPGSIQDRSWIVDAGSILDRCRIDRGSMPDRSWIDARSILGRSRIDPALIFRSLLGSNHLGSDPLGPTDLTFEYAWVDVESSSGHCASMGSRRISFGPLETPSTRCVHAVPFDALRN